MRHTQKLRVYGSLSRAFSYSCSPQDSAATLETQRPTLPVCFRETVLAAAPGLVLWLCLPLYLLHLRSLPVRHKWRDKTAQNIITLVR